MVLFAGAPLDDPGRRDWWVAPLAGGAPRSSGAGESITNLDIVDNPAAWEPGRLLVIAGTTIEGVNVYSARISAEGRINGPVSTLVAGPAMTWKPGVSITGRLALSRFSWVIHLWEVGLDPTTGAAAGPPRRITEDATPKLTFSLSRDGDLLAYSTYAGSRGDRRAAVVLHDRTNDTRRVAVTLLDERASTSAMPRLSGDGSMLTWSTVDGGQRETWVAPIDDPRGVELCRDCLVRDFFSEGHGVLVQRGNVLTRVSLEDGHEDTVLSFDGMAILDCDLSPDDGWLLVQVGKPDGTVAILAHPITDQPSGAGAPVVIAEDTEWHGTPRWSADGGTVYFLSDRDDFICVWGQHVDPATKAPFDEPFAVVHRHTSQMNTMRDFRRAWTFEVSEDRLVFNAGEFSGDVFTAMLRPVS
jgi:dipeptidyl aminopeptidase/acylaminoacyl peptidase